MFGAKTHEENVNPVRSMEQFHSDAVKETYRMKTTSEMARMDQIFEEQTGDAS